MDKPLRCKLGVHRYIDVKSSETTYGSIFRQCISDFSIRSREYYRNDHRIVSRVFKKLKIRKHIYFSKSKEIVYDKVCIICGKPQHKIDALRKKINNKIDRYESKVIKTIAEIEIAEMLAKEEKEYKEAQNGLEV